MNYGRIIDVISHFPGAPPSDDLEVQDLSQKSPTLAEFLLPLAENVKTWMGYDGKELTVEDVAAALLGRRDCNWSEIAWACNETIWADASDSVKWELRCLHTYIALSCLWAEANRRHRRNFQYGLFVIGAVAQANENRLDEMLHFLWRACVCEKLKSPYKPHAIPRLHLARPARRAAQLATKSRRRCRP